MNYYNERDPYAAEWLRNLVDAGVLPRGDVDDRDLLDVRPSDLAGYTQCHFFAGLGGWPHALQCAGWPNDRRVWTGSCPCQPFSTAGKNLGFADERHLWPYWLHLIGQCRPPEIFGEQVASKDALDWLDLVYADLEAAGYAFGVADLCAAGFGAPHIRQRLYFVANRHGHGLQEGGAPGFCAYPKHDPEPRSGPRVVANRHDARLEVFGVQPAWEERKASERSGPPDGTTGATKGYWGGADWVYCRDDRWRPVEPGSFPLADGVPGRVGRLRAYGNAFVAPLATEFVKAYLET